MWQKTRSILAYVHEHYIAEYDYVHVAGDDTYVIVENLRNYLEFTVEAKHGRGKVPLYLGQRVFSGGGYTFVGGGPGYILNRLALQRFIKEALSACLANQQEAAEDRSLGYCFKTLEITTEDTADAFHRQRFHGVDPYFLATKNPQKGFWKRLYKFWAREHGYKWGIGLVSPQTVTFHLIKSPIWMKRMHAMLYHACPTGTAMGDLLPRPTKLANIS
jgi:glycoprotein-N-acetylgalactosamine 3-beta-galactosyltransferase